MRAGPSLDDLGGLQAQGFRDGEPQRLRRLHVDDEVQLGRLLHCKLRGLRPFEDPIGVRRGATTQIGVVRTVGDQRARPGRGREREYRPQALFHRDFDEPISMPKRERARLNDEDRSAALLHRRHDVVQLREVTYTDGAELYTHRLRRAFRGAKPVLAVPPGLIPDVVDRGLRPAELSGELDVLAAEIKEDVTEPGRVSTRP